MYVCIAEAVEHRKSLQKIWLSGNDIGDDGKKALEGVCGEKICIEAPGPRSQATSQRQDAGIKAKRPKRSIGCGGALAVMFAVALPNVVLVVAFSALPHCIGLTVFRGNHLSNTTCLTHTFFKAGEECSKS